jgi:hypothetical protein
MQAIGMNSTGAETGAAQSPSRPGAPWRLRAEVFVSPIACGWFASLPEETPFDRHGSREWLLFSTRARCHSSGRGVEICEGTYTAPDMVSTI